MSRIEVIVRLDEGLKEMIEELADRDYVDVNDELNKLIWIGINKEADE